MKYYAQVRIVGGKLAEDMCMNFYILSERAYKDYIQQHGEVTESVAYEGLWYFVECEYEED